MRATPLRRTLTVLTLALGLAVGLLPAADLDRNPEEVRESMRSLAAGFERLATGNPAVAARAARLQQTLGRLTVRQVDMLAETLADAPGTLDAVDRFNANLNVDIGLEPGGEPGTLADPVFSETCGDIRPDAATVAEQLAMWEGLAAAAAAAQATCDAAPAEEIVDACEVAGMAGDAALIARFAYENSAFCASDIDSAIADATLATLGEVGASVDQVGSDLLDALAAHDTEIKDALAAEGQAIRDLLAEVLANQSTLLANQGAILDNQDVILDNQDTILLEIQGLRQLILTPPGRRPGWNRYPHPSENGNGSGPDGSGN